MRYGVAEVAEILLRRWDPLAVRNSDLLPESEYRYEAAEVLDILAGGGSEAEVREYLTSSELATSVDPASCALAAQEIASWFSDEQRFLEALPPLVRAAAQGDVAAVERLLADGVPPDAADADGWSGLHAAAVRGHTAVVGLLLDRGCEVDTRSADGVTPLLNAAGPCEDPEVIRVLLDGGADPDATEARFGWNPLSRAAEYCRPDAVRLLLEAGADATHVELTGFTLLMTAAESGCYEVIELLLRAGADATLEYQGKRAAQLAREREFFDCAELLDRT